MLQTKDYKHFRVGSIEFDGANLASRALPGDMVEVDLGQVIKIVERAKHGHIVGTLELASKVRYGITSHGYPIYSFVPFAESYPPFFVGCSQKDVSQNVLAIVDFAHWDAGTCPRGNLARIIGPAGEIAVEEEALALHASPVRWKKLEPLVEPPEIADRSIGITFHVDPPGCKDIDDAITLNPLPGFNIGVKIHIADVSSWLVANPWLAEKAAAIGQTLYRDGVAIKPMFPAQLSEDIFSLLPGKDRRAWTLSFIWNTALKAVSGIAWSLEMVRVSQSFTYHSVTKSILAKELEEICSGLAGHPLTDSHEWIEQLMIFYNCEAAKLLYKTEVGVLRRHSAPDEARFAAYDAAGLPAKRLAMSAGEYCSSCEFDVKHWGLGQDFYCHASSPIRRWSDCLNQLAIRRQILDELPEPIGQPVIDLLNARSKAIKAYERDIVFMRAVLGDSKEVEGQIAEEGRVWVPAWGRIVKAETTGAAGTAVKIKFFCDATKRNWKRRMVLNVVYLDFVQII
jgi:exoribonuclease R